MFSTGHPIQTLQNHMHCAGSLRGVRTYHHIHIVCIEGPVDAFFWQGGGRGWFGAVRIWGPKEGGMCQQKGKRAFVARREQIDNKDLEPWVIVEPARVHVLVVSTVVRTSYNSPHLAT